jgi:hypothetical protein
MGQACCAKRTKDEPQTLQEEEPLQDQPYPSLARQRGFEMFLQNFDIFLEPSRQKTLVIKLRVGSYAETNDWVQLFTALRDYPTLQSLTIDSGNEGIPVMGIDAFAQSCESFGNLRHLALTIGNTSVETIDLDREMQLLAEGLNALPSLARLELRVTNVMGDGGNLVKDMGMTALAESIANLTELTHLLLHFPNQRITDDSISTLSKSLSNLYILQQLSLCFNSNDDAATGGYFANNITDLGVSELSRAFLYLNQLSMFTLNLDGGSNGVTDNGMGYLAKGLFSAKALQKVYINVAGGLNKTTEEGRNRTLTTLQWVQDVNVSVNVARMRSPSAFSKHGSEHGSRKGSVVISRKGSLVPSQAASQQLSAREGIDRLY